MFCNKCGTENIDGSAFCSKCGEKINVVEGNPVEINTVENNNNITQVIDKSVKKEKTDKNIYTGFLLNIFSVIVEIIALILFICFNVNFYNMSETCFLSCIGALFVNFVIGLIICFTKEYSVKKVLSYIYLALTTISCCVLIIGNFMMYVCFLFWLVTIPFVMQIVAGIKFLNGMRNYEA